MYTNQSIVEADTTDSSNSSFSEDKEPETSLDYIDHTYTKIEGNSKFYWLIAFPVGFAYWFGYSRLIPFLILIPKLTCSFNGGSDWMTWSEVEAWANPQTLYQIDYSTQDTISNWITELDLVCIPKFNLGIFGSLYFVGYVVGALTFVRLGDIIGRKPVLLFGTTLFWLASIGTYFATNLYLMYFLTFLIGTFEMVRFSLAYLLMIELLPKDRRNKYYAACTITESIICLIIVGYWWQFQNAYHILIATIVLSFVHVISTIITPESPKLLYSVGRFKEMNESLSYIAKMNGTTFTKDDIISESKSEQVLNEQKAVGFFESLKEDPVYRNNLFIMAFNWWVCSISCYMTLYYVGMYPGNLYVNATIIFVGDTISTLLANTFAAYFGFTKGFSLTFTFVFLTSVGFEIFNSIPQITYWWVLIMRLGIILCFDMWYLWQSEYFKTNLSSRSFAFCNVLARILTIFSPVIVTTLPHPILIITTLSLIASISSRYLVKQ